MNIIPYTAEAYVMKKYAFVSDYARFWILYHFGGNNFDTDVEVIASMDHIISQGAFMGQEGITIYPPEYFCPKDFQTREFLNMTDNTVSIHHYDASWQGKTPHKNQLEKKNRKNEPHLYQGAFHIGVFRKAV